MNISAVKAIALLMLTGFTGGPASIQPGQWETVTTFSALDGPGIPAAPDPGRQALMAPQTQTQCINAEDAANPTRRMLKPNGTNRCRFTESVFAGGVIKIHATCELEGGGTSDVKIQGTYTATSMSTRMHIISRQAGASAPARYRLSGNMTLRRTGECTGPAAH
jgi:hypothetical protein